MQLGGDDVEVVLDLTENDDYECGYYLVLHSQRTLFWLDSIDSKVLSRGVKGVTDLAHISMVFYILRNVW